MCEIGRRYTVPISAIGATAAQDLLEINSAADAVTILEGVVIDQSSDTDSEQLRVTIQRGATTSGSGGAAVTPVPLDPGDAAFAGTCERNNTTRATGGTPVIIVDEAFNVLNGWRWPAIPMVVVINPSQRLIVGLETAPADSLTISGYAIIREIGS